MFSGNRTPKFATGLVRYFARPNGQTVVILTGGLEAFKAAAIAAGKPELREFLFIPCTALPECPDTFRGILKSRLSSGETHIHT